MTAPDDRARVLLLRQVLLTALAVFVLALVWLFAQTQAEPQPAAAVDRYLQAHRPRDPGSLRLAYAQLFVAAAVALMALGHAAHVVAFVFRRKVS